MSVALPLTACGETEPDPHAGMIYVNTGTEYEWVYPAEGVPVSDLSPDDFTESGNVVAYKGEAYDTLLGVDVSFYQGDVDWQAVKDSGVDFAMIRCGYRGATEGNIYEDETFRQNIEGALAAGLRVGAYFFSQSLGAQEAAEEAQFVIGLLADYDITMPVAFDWEPISDSRTDAVDADALTASAVVFCEMVKDAGYDPAVYLYRYLAYHDYDLTRLKDYTLWVGAPGSAPDFYYACSIWQFSYTGSVPGISTDVDMNLYFTKAAGQQASE
jgi:GH25 family lysozyme M1 (1,4-beta-N-acetylmuramidase)